MKKLRILIYIILIIMVGIAINWVYENTIIKDTQCLEKISTEYCESQNLSLEGTDYYPRKFGCRELTYNERTNKYPSYHYFYFTEEEWDSCHCKLKEKNCKMFASPKEVVK